MALGHRGVQRARGRELWPGPRPRPQLVATWPLPAGEGAQALATRDQRTRRRSVALGQRRRRSAYHDLLSDAQPIGQCLEISHLPEEQSARHVQTSWQLGDLRACDREVAAQGQAAGQLSDVEPLYFELPMLAIFRNCPASMNDMSE